jgi:hypothetical protein
MESTMLLVLALCGAVGTIALFAIIRSTMASPLTPGWIASEPIAYILALLLTGTVSTSVAFLGYALSAVVPSSIAFIGTFVVHGGLLAAYLGLMAKGTSKDASGTYRDAVSTAS